MSYFRSRYIRVGSVSYAGYDLRTKDAYTATWELFDNIIGFEYLAGLHLNDSRSTLGSKRDLHANLGYLAFLLDLFLVMVSFPLSHSG